MQLNSLTLSQFRAFQEAKFDFVAPGMNLLVGINGVGKTSVLDAIRIAFSRVVPKFTASKESPINFSIDDITRDRDKLTVQLNFMVSDIPFECYVSRDKKHEFGLKPDRKDILLPLKSAIEQPLVIYFSIRRSMSFDIKEPSTKMAAGDQSVAFVEALKPRTLRLQDFATWWLAQADLESSSAQNRLEVLKNAVTIFLDSCTNLRAVRREGKATLMLDKNGTSFYVSQLSDGERGSLALVFDLALRLVQANPELDDPLRNGKAIVLIDELDLHLHPKWQRAIVQRLSSTFPSCQFIVTTHSPQIIGEVPPENILILENGEIPYQPKQSLGMDSNWVLRYLMDASERDLEAKNALEHIANLIEHEEYDTATDAIDDLRAKVGEFPELVRLQTRIDRIRLLGD